MGGPEARRFARLRRTTIIGLDVPVATTFVSRLLGLALLDVELAPRGLLIPRCSCVHTVGMRFALDLLFVDESGRVVELRRAVGPGRIACCAAARQVLELPSP